MTTDEIHAYFGSIRKAIKAIGLTRTSFYYWISQGKVPYERQKEYEKLTNGALKASEYSFDQTIKESEIFPIYRFYCEKLGMCKIRSLTFKAGNRPTITYFHSNNESISFTSFNNENLMQGFPIFDSLGKQLFENDIVIKLKSSIEYTIKLLEFCKYDLRENEFTIIGNIFERIKNGHKGSK